MQRIKKITVVFSIILIINQFIMSIFCYKVEANEIIDNDQINNEYEEELDDYDLYSEEYKEYLNLTDEEKAKLEVIPEKYDIDIDDFFRTYGNNDENKCKNLAASFSLCESASESTIPTKFDLRDEFNITVENQGQEGLCWAFASLGALRTHLALKNGTSSTTNFSERHLDYLTSNLYTDKGMPGNREHGDGGNFSYTIRYFMNNDGPVYESIVPYDSSYSTSTELAKLDSYQPTYYVHDVIQFPNITKKAGKIYNGSKEITVSELNTVRNKIKSHIMNNGGLYCTIRTNSAFTGGSKRSAQYDDGSISNSECGGHAITIIGWDDSYSKDNFEGQFKPKSNGAYLILNSYGPDAFENGYQWVSYEDYSVERYLGGYLSVDKTKNEITAKFNSQKVYEEIKSKFSSYPVTTTDSIKTIKVLDLIDNYNKTATINLNNKSVTDSDLSEVFKFSFNNLNTLYLQGNDITDITPLRGHNNLTFLNISNNKITNIAPIVGMVNLTNLNISNNNISAIGPIYGMSDLQTLTLSNNPIENFGVLNSNSYSNLTTLNIVNAGFTDNDLKYITNRNSLTSLNLNNNGLKNINSLNKLTNIKTLYLQKNSIEDISDLDTNQYTTFLVSNQDIQKNIGSEVKEIDYPSIYLKAKDTSSKVYSSTGFTFVGCKEKDDGTGIIIDRTADEIYVKINKGNAANTKMQVSKLVEGIQIKTNTEGIGIGKKLQLIATVIPEDATNKNITWSSGNTQVATVDDNGLIVGITEGTVKITATSEEGNYTDSIDIIIDGTPPSLSVNQQGKTNKIIIQASDELSGLNSVLIDGKKVTLIDGQLVETIKVNKNYTIEATDNAGNTTTQNIIINMKLGDLNNNNSIETNDLLKMQRYIFVQQTGKNEDKWNLTEEEKVKADVNQDGNINTIDVLKIKRYIAANKNENIAQKHKDWLELGE